MLTLGKNRKKSAAKENSCTMARDDRRLPGSRLRWRPPANTCSGHLRRAATNGASAHGSCGCGGGWSIGARRLCLAHGRTAAAVAAAAGASAHGGCAWRIGARRLCLAGALASATVRQELFHRKRIAFTQKLLRGNLRSVRTPPLRCQGTRPEREKATVSTRLHQLLA